MNKTIPLSTVHYSLTPSRPSIPERPRELPNELSKDQVRQSAVTMAENKQQQQMVETYIKSSSQANDDDGNPVGLNNLQALAQLNKTNQLVQVINANEGEKLKSMANQYQNKIVKLFQDIQDYKLT